MQSPSENDRCWLVKKLLSGVKLARLILAIHLGLPVVSIRQSHLGGRFPVVWQQLFYGVLMPWQPGQHIFQVGIGNGTTDMGISMRMFLCGLLFAAVDGAGRLTGTNAGTDVSVLSLRRDSLIQRRTRLALRPLSRAMRETEAPGSRQVATIPALNSREWRRRFW